jgi:replicative DNA helicase
MEGLYGTLREENIERANRIKQLTKFFNIPVIVTAELRKKQQEYQGKEVKGPTMHDLMESGKYGYNADVVWLITPQDEDEYRTEDAPVIEIAFEKNKLSSYRENMLMTFMRAQSSMVPYNPTTGGN